MRTISTERDAAVVELRLDELGLLMNALWQELGYQEARSEPLSPDLREAYEALQAAILAVIAEMDAEGAEGANA